MPWTQGKSSCRSPPEPLLRRTGDQLAVRAPFEPDPPFVGEVMMPPAQQRQVENQRRPAIRPVFEVMTLRPGHRPIAARETTVLIARDQGSHHRGRYRAARAAGAHPV